VAISNCHRNANLNLTGLSQNGVDWFCRLPLRAVGGVAVDVERSRHARPRKASAQAWMVSAPRRPCKARHKPVSPSLGLTALRILLHRLVEDNKSRPLNTMSSGKLAEQHIHATRE
jgi:hypothetical protein